MRKGGGKAKGAAFEREICRKLSLWVSKGTQEDVFWRSAMSGGRSTIAARKGKRLAAQSGDISCIHPIGAAFAEKFYPECKDYADLNFIGLLTGKGHLLEFWKETVKQAAHYGKLPLLIAHQKRHPVIACISHEGRIALQVSFAGQCVVTSPPNNLLIVLFDEMLRNVPPDF